jgi:type II secretory pathway component PulJ
MVRMNLAELLTSVALVGLVLGGLLVALDQGQRVYATGSAGVEVTQNARAALARMATEIRQAGRGPRPDVFVAIAEAAPESIVLQHDLNGNGVIAGVGETITWRLAGNILRRNAGGGAQPIINGVTALSFAYFDAQGRPAASLAAIRTVTISLTTAPTHTASALAKTSPHTLTTRVQLRNR